MTIAIEEQRIRRLFDRVEEVEDVANSLPEGDDRRSRLLSVSNATLAEEATIRPVIAARLLGLSLDPPMNSVRVGVPEIEDAL